MQKRNSVTFSLVLLGLVFILSLGIFILQNRGGDSFQPAGVFNRIAGYLETNAESGYDQGLKSLSRMILNQESRLGYILIRPDGGTETVSLFRGSDQATSQQALTSLKASFNQLGGSPRGFFRSRGMNNYFRQIQAKDGQWYWVQLGSLLSTSQFSWVNTVTLALIFMSAVGGLAILLFKSWPSLRQQWVDAAPTASAGASVTGRQTAAAVKRRPFFEKKRIAFPVITAKARKVLEPAEGKNATDAAAEQVEDTIDISEAARANARVELDDVAPPPRERLELKVKSQASQEEERSRENEKNGQGDEFSLNKRKKDPFASQLLYWEHSSSLYDFWKKFLQRLQVYCQGEDYLFLFIKKNFEQQSLQRIDELEGTLGLKGSVFLSSSYIRDNKVGQKLSLQPLLNIKGSLSPSRQLLQLPLVSGKHVYGALLVYRKKSQIDEIQVKQLWSEINTLSAEILKIKLYDRALRDENTGLFNLRHFQYSLAQNYKLKGNIPSRSLALFQFCMPFEESHPYYSRISSRLAAHMQTVRFEDEELYAFRTEDKKFTIAVIGEARPLESFESRLNKVFQSDTGYEKNRVWINGGVCVLYDSIYSPRRWLDQALITLQESVHRGRNYIAQSSPWQKSEYLQTRWHEGESIGRG